MKLPQKQWIFSIPKALRIFFKHNRMLFSDISQLIFNMLQSYIFPESMGFGSGWSIVPGWLSRAGRRNIRTILADSKQLSAETPECPVAEEVQKSTWARLIKKSLWHRSVSLSSPKALK